MDIHVVKAGDTLYKIAQRYGVSVDSIFEANKLSDFPHLVIGQALVIPTAMVSHTVKPGESVFSIASRYGTTPDSIIALNAIQNPNMILPGTVLQIPVREKNFGFIEVNGYIEPSTAQRDTQIMQDVGDYLTYIAPFSYQVREDASLAPIDDSAILAQAQVKKVAPLLVVTNFKGGNFDTELVDSILDSTKLQDTLIQNIITVLKQKGYYGVNIDFERISPDKREAYNSFLRRLTAALHPLNYVVSTALAPKDTDVKVGAWHGAHDYAAHGEVVDFVIIMTYEWGWSGGPPYAVAPADLVEDVIRYAVSVIPSRKIIMGMPLYGYDWQLPFMPGGGWAKRLSAQQAVLLAAKVGAEIHFDEQTQSPTFSYYDQSGAKHVVWFEDARSVHSKFLLVNKYDLRGVSYWLLGLLFPQNWVVLDSMFNIVKVV